VRVAELRVAPHSGGKMRRSLRLWWLLPSIAAVALACPKPSPPLPPAPVAGERETYVIGVTDGLDIRVWRNPELSTQVVVRSDGKISVPLIDDVQAEGLTPEELREVITHELSEYISSPDVTVVVSAMNSNTVSVIGGVGRPGQVPLRRDTTILEAIAASGGFGPWAKKSRIRLLRRTPEGIQEYRFDYEDYLDGDVPPETNLVLKPGDTIVVPD